MLDDSEVAVVGAGLMGAGIAQVFAALDVRVALHDPFPDSLASAPDRIAANLEAIGQDPAIAGRVRLCDELVDAVGSADWVFEAAPEDLELKRELFVALDALAPRSAILATNSSVTRVSQIADRATHRDRIVGTHWWNPPYLVPLVEVVPGEDTGPDAVSATLELLHCAGKTPVRVKRDVPGLIGNRLQHALWRQAFALVDEGVCEPEAIDTVIKASFGPRLTVLGPMENADLVGLDLTKQIHDYVLPTLDPPSGTAACLDALVAEGRLGAKSGAGFGPWDDERAAATRRRLLDHLAARTPVETTGGTS